MSHARKPPAASWLTILPIAACTLGCGGPSPQTNNGTPPAEQPAQGTSKPPAKAAGGEDAPAASLRTPEGPVAGKIHGQAFQPTKIELSSGHLVFSTGEGFFHDQEVVVMLDASEGLDGKRFQITDPEQFIKPYVQVRWKSGDSKLGERAFIEKYVMRVEFGQREKRRLPGNIYFRSLDAGNDTELAGRFVIELGPDFTQPPTEEDAPYVYGRVALKGAEEFELSAGFMGGPDDGEILRNGAGATFRPGERGNVTSLTFKPQITSLGASGQEGLNYRHLVLQPGTYFVYILWDDAYVDGRWLEVPEGGRLTADLEVDASRRGSLEVQVPGAGEDTVVMLTPLGQQQELPPAAQRLDLARRLKLFKKPESGKATFPGLNAGRYHVAAGMRAAVAEVVAGETSTLQLPATD